MGFICIWTATGLGSDFVITLSGTALGVSAEYGPDTNQ
jgi:hypothetical protein